MRRISIAITLASWLLGALAVSDAFADDLDAFSLHGFGTQTYSQTSANTYLGADHSGTWDNNFLGLVGTVKLNDKSKLWAQLEASSADTTHFTWFFVDYQLSEDSTVHAGRVKLPLGIYNDTIDTKFLQQSSLEPALYQTAADIVSDAYTGLGYDHDQRLGGAGNILWQFYGGNNHDDTPPADSRDRRIAGARVTYDTPVIGLRFLLSANLTQVQILATGKLVDETRWIASVDYLQGLWDLKSEYGGHHLMGVASDAYYVQIGRTFAAHWTAFGRYDHVTTNEALQSSNSFSQKIIVAGLNFMVRSNLSIRLEDQFNHGYALPVANREVAPDAGKTNWSLLIAGVHFIF
jgi:Phosphate-selective porin O and P